MRYLNKKEFNKVTKKIYKKNGGELIFDACMHFKWNVQDQHAETLIKEDEEGICYCPCCCNIQSRKTMENIQKLVDYLNEGGRDDKIMTKLYKDVHIYEWAVIYPGRIVDNFASCDFGSGNLERSFGYEEVPICIENELC